MYKNSVSAAKCRYAKRHLDRITLNFKKEDGARLREEARSRGLSLNKMLINIVKSWFNI